MHTILYDETDRLDTENYQALKQRLRETGARGREDNGERDRQGARSLLGRLLAHDDGAQLTVVPYQHHLLSAHHYGNHALWLSRLQHIMNTVSHTDRQTDTHTHIHCYVHVQYLSALINEDHPKLKLGQSWITGTHTRAADDVGTIE